MINNDKSVGFNYINDFAFRGKIFTGLDSSKKEALDKLQEIVFTIMKLWDASYDKYRLNGVIEDQVQKDFKVLKAEYQKTSQLFTDDPSLKFGEIKLWLNRFDKGILISTEQFLSGSELDKRKKSQLKNQILEEMYLVNRNISFLNSGAQEKKLLDSLKSSAEGFIRFLEELNLQKQEKLSKEMTADLHSYIYDLNKATMDYDKFYTENKLTNSEWTNTSSQLAEALRTARLLFKSVATISLEKQEEKKQEAGILTSQPTVSFTPTSSNSTSKISSVTKVKSSNAPSTISSAKTKSNNSVSIQSKDDADVINAMKNLVGKELSESDFLAIMNLLQIANQEMGAILNSGVSSINNTQRRKALALISNSSDLIKHWLNQKLKLDADENASNELKQSVKGNLQTVMLLEAAFRRYAKVLQAK